MALMLVMGMVPAVNAGAAGIEVDIKNVTVDQTYPTGTVFSYADSTGTCSSKWSYSFDAPDYNMIEGDAKSHSEKAALPIRKYTVTVKTARPLPMCRRLPRATPLR